MSQQNQGQQNQGAFRRVAVVNRGEPAMRLINAVREWNAEGRPFVSSPCTPPLTGARRSSARPTRRF